MRQVGLLFDTPQIPHQPTIDSECVLTYMSCIDGNFRIDVCVRSSLVTPTCGLQLGTFGLSAKRRAPDLLDILQAYTLWRQSSDTTSGYKAYEEEGGEVRQFAGKNHILWGQCCVSAFDVLY